MKVILAAMFCFFIFCLTSVKGGNIINIIQNDGEILKFDIEKIKNLNFKDASFSSECTFKLSNDSSITFRLYRIISMFSKSGINSSDSLVVDYNEDAYFGFISKLYSFPIEHILSLSFSNFNEFNNKILKKISINLSGLQAIFNDENNPKEFNGNFSVSNTGDNGDWGQSVFCRTCYKNNIIADFNFCKSNHQFSIEDISHQTCYFYNAEIYLDTINGIIDSILYVYQEKDYDLPNTGGSWRDETDYYTTLNLFSLPYTIEENGDLKVDIGITDLSNIKYTYNYDNVSGSSGGYTSKHIRFIKFLPPNDSSRISIIISSED